MLFIILTLFLILVAMAFATFQEMTCESLSTRDTAAAGHSASASTTAKVAVLVVGLLLAFLIILVAVVVCCRSHCFDAEDGPVPPLPQHRSSARPRTVHQGNFDRGLSTPPGNYTIPPFPLGVENATILDDERYLPRYPSDRLPDYELKLRAALAVPAPVAADIDAHIPSLPVVGTASGFANVDSTCPSAVLNDLVVESMDVADVTMLST